MDTTSNLLTSTNKLQSPTGTNLPVSTNVSVSQSPIGTSQAFGVPSVTSPINNSMNGGQSTTTPNLASIVQPPINKGRNKLKVEYYFDDYEDSFFTKQNINDPLKLSVIPDLLSLQSEKRTTNIVGSNIPQEVLEKFQATEQERNKSFTKGVQESLDIFNQDWLVVNREPLPSAQSQPLKPLTIQHFSADNEFDSVSPTESVKDLNKDLEETSKLSTPDPKSVEFLKTSRVPLFQTYYIADELPQIDPPKIGKKIIENIGFQFKAECTDFKAQIGNFEPFFGRMFLFDANKVDESNLKSPEIGIVSEVFHFDLNHYLNQDLLPKINLGVNPLNQINPLDNQSSTKFLKSIFTCDKSEDVYLVVCFDKVILGDPEETTKNYFNPPKPKDLTKFQGEVKEGVSRLGRFKQTFIWGCLELFDSNKKFNFDQGEVEVKITNFTKMKFDQLYTFVTKEKKANKDPLFECTLKIQQCSVSLDDNKYLYNETIDGRIDYLLRPKVPNQSGAKPGSDGKDLVKEVLYFNSINSCSGDSVDSVHYSPKENGSSGNGNVNSPSSPSSNTVNSTIQNGGNGSTIALPREIKEPHLNFSNVLYFYPKSVNLTNLDHRGSARNIFLEVKLMEDDSSVTATGLKSVYGTTTSPLLCCSFITSVVYHNKKPKFSDEIKINLPAKLTPNHHLLVTFYHLGCKKTKKADNSVNTPLGFSVVRLFDDDCIIVDGKYKSPIGTVFPPRYLAHEAKDIKDQKDATNHKVWVDNKKPLFSFKTRVISSLYPQDHTLSVLLKESTLADHSLLNEYIKKLPSVPSSLKTQFFPAIIRLLFKAITSLSSEIGANSFNVLLNLLDSVPEDVLTSYSTYIFNNSNAGSITLYDSLVQVWNQLLEGDSPATTNQPNIKDPNQTANQQGTQATVPNPNILNSSELITLSVQYSWFLFGIIKKSMIVHIDLDKNLRTGRNRRGRLPDEVLGRFTFLFELLLTQLKQTKQLVAKNFIVNIGYFINDLLDILSRSFVFPIIENFVHGLDSGNQVMELTELKSRFFRVLASSDSFIALNLASPIQPFPSINQVFQVYFKKHFTIGLILQEVYSVITANEKEMRLKVIHTLREIISKIDTNQVYNSQPMRERIADLFFPYLLIVVYQYDVINRFDHEEQRSWLAIFIYIVKNLNNTNILSDWWKKETSKNNVIFFTILTNCLTLFDYAKEYNVNPIGQQQQQVNNSDEDSDKSSSVNNTLTHHSTYSTDSNIVDSPSKKKDKGDKEKPSKASTKANVSNIKPDKAKALIEQSLSSSSGFKQLSNLGASTGSTNSAGGLSPSPLRAFASSATFLVDYTAIASPEVVQMMYGNMCNEVVLTVLNSLLVFIKEFKQDFKNSTASPGYIENIVFRVILSILKQDLAFSSIKVVFCVLSTMVSEFRDVLFKQNNSICADLTQVVFKYCCSKHSSSRQYATTLIYLMIQNNLVSTHHFSRMKLHSTIAISQILNEIVEKNSQYDSNVEVIFNYLKACLESITQFVKSKCSDALLSKSGSAKPSLMKSPNGKSTVSEQNNTFNPIISKQIEQLKERLNDVISNNIKIMQHSYDPEMKADLYYNLSNTFIESPDLRITWLKSLKEFLKQQKSMEEAAQVSIIAAALVAGYLKLLNRFPKELSAPNFNTVSPNVIKELTFPDISLFADVEGEICKLEHFTEPGFINLLKDAIQIQKSGYFESAAETYRLLLPTYIHQKDWTKQRDAYQELVILCSQIISENVVSQRIFSSYYRVAFFCKKLNEHLHGKVFIYKENNYVRLSDLSDRLKDQYSNKFGQDKFHLLPNNKIVDESQLEIDHFYIQIISVDPYLTPDELKERKTPFEQNNHLNKFIFEIPFTKSGKVHSENITEQWKKKVTLKTENYFPYLKKRLEVVSKEEVEMTPIEASIELIQKKDTLLKAELNSRPANTKTLQIHLQGCLLLQVNAGPLAICSSFLGEGQYQNHKAEHIQKLSEVMRSFDKTLRFAVIFNRSLIGEAAELNKQLTEGYNNFREKVSQYVNLTNDDDY
ncbi:hypothetical protein DICPUDRAFT_153700 [Dictyostelium purpureum]|uniref:DOCK family protein n=1 Tax=Dictyostelium purpureum TaxID=5786 RepID=F0ZPJ5_DICPU|nr:uncharacterized protein DICPUDRAFT_153700 [Dictyostelium purpureum]EGC34144.1 hypothetical protein DICPUDRAFT_153700 [Dictyostelium purpureum]|eukprot:XP_003289342.1 hypothetical protein DICPUDRAFT_153700 [Dictyostelium purpureum]